MSCDTLFLANSQEKQLHLSQQDDLHLASSEKPAQGRHKIHRLRSKASTIINTKMKRRAAMTISPLNAETRLKRLRMKSLHNFAEEIPAPMTCADANTAAQKGPVGIIDEKKMEHAASSSHHRQVSSSDSSADTSCLSSSLIGQLASISIKEEKKSSRTLATTPTKRGSLPFTVSKPLQKHIKTAQKRASAPPIICLAPKKKVHSRRRNRVVILNNKIMTKTQGRRESISSCLHFEPISLSSFVTP